MDKHRNPDGTYDGAGVMSELSGMQRSEVLARWEQVKANQAKLDACPWHEFERYGVDASSKTVLRQKYRCKHCLGEIDHIAYHWHEQGRRQLVAVEDRAAPDHHG